MMTMAWGSNRHALRGAFWELKYAGEKSMICGGLVYGEDMLFVTATGFRTLGNFSIYLPTRTKSDIAGT